MCAYTIVIIFTYIQIILPVVFQAFAFQPFITNPDSQIGKEIPADLGL